MQKLNEPSQAVKDMQGGWAKIDALCGGTDAMRAAGELYLPRFKSENPADYDYRLKTSTLFNALEHTIENLASKPFAEPIKHKDIGATAEVWMDNIDLSERNLHVFAGELLTAGIKYGLTHILADYSRAGSAKTLADERALGLRPYAVHILPTSILGWKSSKIGGVERLTQLRIREAVKVDDGPFGTKDVTQVRVLEIGKWSTYRENEKSEWVIFEFGQVMLNAQTPLDFIPLVTFYTKRTGFMTAAPPLRNLADLNIEHWQSYSDQTTILHVARVPILARIGVINNGDTPAPISIGASSLIDLPANADLKFVEHSGEAAGAGRESIRDIEERMRFLGAELLIPTAGNVTATQAALDSSSQQCQLSAMAQGLENALDKTVHIMQRWAGLAETGTIDVFDDFVASAITGQTESVLLAAAQAGLISRETFFNEMVRRSAITPDLSWETEIERPPNKPLPPDVAPTNINISGS
ncbi:DUF4055 domain-containing protein [Pseudomonas sp. CCC3.2]|uniref:DUF4055 domain-containing protein n=1 Tax=unclassified Pseudomonas TaxID=196821 RepID=UPI002AB40F84|nr:MULTISPECIES: DUF4055 domain-containing protein [unclassified Pseudomonas]MDY7559952.1 DUF4055 domain-containing protein [Pseudomonas sp. AB6]MEA9994548.1 DUF4055 domain-containing protein [Pseudomonas sp. AA4]MEB0085693.1 DUF4055 domain-containing protein [Pseudomonas sp. RTI1]MEB0125982.1 DUF4055 domain-containing protein [Pseudomonas sp. CCC1.2]MEB0152786.1 DUF4055 domain-containing protein [Pseudomonas sp. CCC4.3]